MASAPRPANHATIRDCVGNWLRNASIQMTHGIGSGGVAGVVGARGEIPYVYGEITGYWLRWASLYAPDRRRIALAVAFLEREWSGHLPGATRVGSIGDWRNEAVFSFDLCMIVRGLADVAPIVGEARCGAAAARVLAWLDRMVGPSGTLLSHLALGDVALPDRWSTRAGPFQMKAAAALLQVPHNWLSPALRWAAHRTLLRWRGKATEHAELHPRFYALEGEIAGDSDFASGPLLSPAGPGGAFPEAIGAPGSRPRADVQAQALRLLCLKPALSPVLRKAVAAALRAYVSEDGRVAFRRDDADGNVWCALFTHQALDWLCRIEGDRSALQPRASDLI